MTIAMPFSYRCFRASRIRTDNPGVGRLFMGVVSMPWSLRPGNAATEHANENPGGYEGVQRSTDGPMLAGVEPAEKGAGVEPVSVPRPLGVALRLERVAPKCRKPPRGDHRAAFEARNCAPRGPVRLDLPSSGGSEAVRLTPAEAVLQSRAD